MFISRIEEKVPTSQSFCQQEKADNCYLSLRYFLFEKQVKKYLNEQQRSKVDQLTGSAQRGRPGPREPPRVHFAWSSWLGAGPQSRRDLKQLRKYLCP